MSAEEKAKKARELWLASNPDMAQVEQMYRESVHSFLSTQTITTSTESTTSSTGQKRNREEQSPLQLECWQRLAVEQLCMILCQSGRADQAKPLLAQLGYVARLATSILDYPTSSSTSSSSSSAASNIACHIWDNFLHDNELKHLQDVFLDPNGDYWKSHNYQLEPPSPYFSYIIPLQKDSNQNISVDTQFGTLGTILSSLHQHLLQKFPKLASAKAVELWAHNRPHPMGHQFHFDSDNEGQGKIIKNPIMTAILYLTAGEVPSVVTNQSLVSSHLASKAVLSLPSHAGRLVAFDGTLLHGVIPGKGTHTGQRRVTLMLAYWRRIRVRPGDTPGAARPFPMAPSEPTSWNQLLVRSSTTTSKEEEEEEKQSPMAQNPVPMDRVYETLDGVPWTKGMGFPDYDTVFQGF